MYAMFLCGKVYLTFTRPVRQEFQFFPERLLALQEIEYNAYRKANEIPATIREQAAPDVTPEALEAEREAEQKKIDESEPLTEEEMAEKEGLISQGFENWSRRDFQQFVRALETYRWTDDYELLASEIVDKTSADVAE